MTSSCNVCDDVILTAIHVVHDGNPSSVEEAETQTLDLSWRIVIVAHMCLDPLPDLAHDNPETDSVYRNRILHRFLRENRLSGHMTRGTKRQCNCRWINCTLVSRCLQK